MSFSDRPDEETKVTTNTSSTLTTEQNQVENRFEVYYKQYYVDSSKNSSVSFDTYLTKALKLISLFPPVNFEPQICSKLVSLPETNKKQTLILDMDETLLHADVDFQYKYHDEILKFNHSYNGDPTNNEEILLPLILRPHLFEFLEFCYQNFEIVLFTASEKSYADAILDFIEKDKKYFSKRLYRNSCLYLHPGIYIKDLSIFKTRELKNITIIDNSVFCFANQINNGVLINSFFNDKNDDMLINLSNYLQMVLSADDVRDVHKENFHLESYLYEIKKCM